MAASLRTALLAACAAVTCLAACASPITSGTVIGKRDTPAYTTIIQVAHYRSQCSLQPVTIGGTTTEQERCTQVLAYYTPQVMYFPEEWELDVRGSNRTGWVGVSPAVYDSAAIGRQWAAGK